LKVGWQSFRDEFGDVPPVNSIRPEIDGPYGSN
jgi:hypothetical protein